MNSAYFPMNKFITYLRSENVIQELLDFYEVNHIKHSVEVYFDNFIEKLDNRSKKNALENERNQLNLDFNSLGKFYEENLHQKKRKK